MVAPDSPGDEINKDAEKPTDIRDQNNQEQPTAITDIVDAADTEHDIADGERQSQDKSQRNDQKQSQSLRDDSIYQAAKNARDHPSQQSHTSIQKHIFQNL